MFQTLLQVGRLEQGGSQDWREELERLRVTLQSSEKNCMVEMSKLCKSNQIIKDKVEELEQSNILEVREKYKRCLFYNCFQTLTSDENKNNNQKITKKPENNIVTEKPNTTQDLWRLIAEVSTILSKKYNCS